MQDTASLSSAPIERSATFERGPCDFCGSSEYELFFEAEDTNYFYDGVFCIVQCKSCGLIFLNPRPKSESIGLYYPDESYTCFKRQGDDSVQLRNNHPLVQILVRYGIKPGAMCDIGCGTGDFLVAAKNSGWNVTGVEPNPYAQVVSQRRLGNQVVASDLYEADFPSGHFQVVTLWHVLEHLPSPARAIQEAHRILTPGGILAIAVPNFDSLEQRLWGPTWIHVDAPRHLYHFTKRSLIRYLETAGFAIVEVLYQPGAISLASNILRTARRLLIHRPQAPEKRAQKMTSMPNSVKTIPTISETQKVIARTWLARLVYPIAWCTAKAKLGPEIMVFARKAL